MLIFDLGGGTFDVTIATLRNSKHGAAVTVLASGGNTRLGGADFDIALRNECVEAILERWEALVACVKGVSRDTDLYLKSFLDLCAHKIISALF